MNLEDYIPRINYQTDFSKSKSVLSAQEFPYLPIGRINYLTLARGGEHITILNKGLPYYTSQNNDLIHFTFKIKYKAIRSSNYYEFNLGYHSFHRDCPAKLLFDKLTQFEFDVCERLPWIKSLIGLNHECK